MALTPQVPSAQMSSALVTCKQVWKSWKTKLVICETFIHCNISDESMTAITIFNGVKLLLLGHLDLNARLLVKVKASLKGL